MLIFWGERGEALQQAAKTEFIGRSASIAHVLESTPSNGRDDILRASGTTYSRFWMTPGPPDASRPPVCARSWDAYGRSRTDADDRVGLYV